MTDPLSLDVLLNEFDPSYDAWVLRDANSGKYVTIPDSKYPERKIIRFFMSREDANTVLDAIMNEGNHKIERSRVTPVKVNLHQAMRGIANPQTPDFADGFVVHTPNEVFETFILPKLRKN